MHALLRRSVRIVAAVALVLLSLAFGAPHAAADYQTVSGGLQQWTWVRSDTPVPMTAAVVRRDGWLVVATGQRFQGDDFTGGGLVLVPPWGGAAVPFGEPPSRTTGLYGYTSLVARGDRLFGLTSIPDHHSSIGQRSRLVELDARSGAVVADHGMWWYPDLAVDPKTGDLVLWTFHCTGQCAEKDEDETAVGAITHQLVRYNPDTHRSAVLLPDAMQADVGGSGTCAARRSELHHCEEVYRVAFSGDGNTLFLGSARGDTNAVDVRDRTGALRFSIPVPRPIDAMRFGQASTCFENTLVMTSFDGTTLGIPNATENTGEASRVRLLASGGPVGFSAAAQTADGNVLTLRRSEGVLLACPPWAPPVPPVPPGVPHAPVAPAARTAAAPTAGPGSPPAPSSTAAPSAAPAPPANVAPPVQPPAMPAVAGPASHATQAVTSVNVGLADVQEEQPVYSLSASSRPSPSIPLAWASLGIGTAAVLGFAAVAFAVIPGPRRDHGPTLAPIRYEVPR